MKMTSLAIPDVVLLEPKVFGDSRGFFMESFNQKRLEALLQIPLHFVQDNHSASTYGTLRGLHYQLPPKAQGKLVRVTKGAVFDVVVDIRMDSPTRGQWVGVVLTDQNHHQLWIPPGLAHGFVVLSPSADFLYKTTDYYAPELERSIRWNDEDLAIQWPIAEEQIILSDKDAHAPRYAELIQGH